MLARSLSQLERIAGRNLTLPVLSCILFDASGDVLHLRATNLELALEVSVPAKILEKGIVAVPAHAISSYMASIEQDKAVTIELKESNVLITSASNTTIIKALAHEDFPAIPAIEDGFTFSTKAKLFLEGLKAVSWSAAQSSMKPELSSIYIYTEDGQLVFVATDSFRLAEKKIKVKTGKDDLTVLIPVKNTADIMRILDTDIDDIEISISKFQIVFKAGSLYLTSRVIEGTFPDYRQIIPKESKTEVTVLKQDLLRAFKVATIFSDKFNKLNIKVDPSEKILEIKTSNSDVGETTTKIEGTTKGESIDINFNYKYIMESMQAITSSSTSFSFNTHGKLVIKGVGDPSFMYLVMPMNR